jgi:hypothetical protein
MIRVMTAAVLCGVAVLLAGCAMPWPMGLGYSKMSVPVTATDNVGKATKIGTAECQTYLNIVALGDASIEAAKKNGGITKVHHVDWSVDNVLGVIGKYKVTVYGE